MSDELPEGWAECEMQNVAEVIGGGTPKANEADNFADVGHAWITPADLSDFTGVFISRGRRSLSGKGLQSCAARMLRPGRC